MVNWIIKKLNNVVEAYRWHDINSIRTDTYNTMKNT